MSRKRLAPVSTADNSPAQSFHFDLFGYLGQLTALLEINRKIRQKKPEKD
jgi:hypothetical protein